jgi:predicted ATPase/DNA-binding winged helix-turn-helix (wHTH) protein
MQTGPLSYQFGEYTLDLGKGSLLRAGEEIKLRPKVYEALKYFVENPGRLISKQELMEAVWAEAFVTDDSLVQCTAELRRALGSSQQFLKTVPKRGYIFHAEVTQPGPGPESISDPRPLDAENERPSSAAKLAGKRYLLPVPRTSLIGRDRQVAEASELLMRPDVRLLSLTGPGGAGKTRLALAVAEAVADHLPGGVRFVGLASIVRPELVLTAIAEALRIRQVANRTVPQLIAEQFKNVGRFLLLLDNFEQVLPAAGAVAETLEACPQLRVLVTSRASLRIYGEREFPVTPLAEDSATELFVQRAAAVWPAFAMTSDDAPAIREICARLDGLPLAIELAAARSKVLSPQAMLDRLQTRLQLLTGGAVDLPQRQQTLRKTIDWSHDLLCDAERQLFRRLSVFAGGCSLEAAEAVCNTSSDLGIDLFHGLSSLVDQNLIQCSDRAGTEPRFAMLETVREYALERLAESGEEEATRRAHAAYCLVLAEEGNPDLSLAQRASWLTQCDAEIDNFRSALDWLFQAPEVDWSLRLCIALFRFWDMRELLAEGRARLEAVLRLAGDEHLKETAKISQFLGALTTAQGDFPAAKGFIEQGLRLYEELGDQWGIAVSWNALAITALYRGDYPAAESSFERSLEYWRKLSDRWAIARCLHNLANIVKFRGDYARALLALQEAAQLFKTLGDRSGAAWSINQQGDVVREQGDIPGARELYEGALSAFRATGDRWGCARSLTDLGFIDCLEGDTSAAHTAYREAVETFASLGHRRGVARTLEGFACLAMKRGDASRALTLAAAAAHIRKLISASLPPAEQSQLESFLRPAWESLSELEAKAAWSEGSAMSMEQAIEYSLQEPASAISA